MKTLVIITVFIAMFIGCTADVNVRQLEISTDLLDFGIVEINKSLFKSFEVYNNTQKILIIQYEFYNNIGEDFELITNGKTESVLPAETLKIEIKVKAKTKGNKFAKLKLSYNHIGSPTEIDIQAESIEHDVQLYPFVDTIDFRYANVNSASFKAIYLKNVGNVETTIERIDFLETNCFYIYPCTLPITLTPDQVLMLNLYFSPKTTGLTTDVMRIYLDSNTKPYDTNLTGNGVLPYVVEYLRKEYFSDNKLPTNWSVEGVNNCWEVGNPDLDTGFKAYSGKYCVGTLISSNYPDNSDTRLVSPEVDLSQSRAPVLSFVQRLNTVYEQWGDGGFIEIRSKSTKNSDDWSSWEILTNIVPIYSVENFNDNPHGAFAGFEDENAWKQISVELYQYRDKIIQIAWHFISDNSENDDGWFIDDVQIFEVRTNVGK